MKISRMICMWYTNNVPCIAVAIYIAGFIVVGRSDNPCICNEMTCMQL